ncbi:MAG: DUF4250 domain-containing protein [Clostridium sp.]|uniref:DUF4250 domain-containing protein n=1 Tax=Clostridium sp. DSM 8431 TaxID=1761781 RepID=UPI0008E49202|nr:DUF4250 domain-containing protein [Clostridium sp. DSM 8431]MCR4944332.1 DUF4250 domain-containing protein [Clostridium sp.]SFU71776.1 protein of unknown function [Clostridium sp. DSM 8431]
MNKEALLAMDPNILVSMVNMRLRDYFDSLEAYCEDVGISVEELNKKLMETGRVYDRDTNQYK